MGKKLIVNENMFGHGEENKLNVPIFVEHCTVTESGMIFPPHWHEQLILMNIRSGSLVLQCVGQEFVANQGDVLVVNPNEIHSGLNPGLELNYDLIKLDLILLIGNQADLQQSKYVELILKNHMLFQNKIKNDKLILSYIANIILEYREHKEGYELAVRGYAYQLLTCLLREYIKVIPTQNDMDMQYRRIKQINGAINYMEEHLSDKITLKDLAEISNLSLIHFSRVFKSISGYSPMDYLNRLRIQRATQLLLESDLTIIQIAMDTGFSDSNYFSRAFKKVREQTPSEFRRIYTKH